MSFFAANWWRSVALAALVALAWQIVRIEGLFFVPGLKTQLADARGQASAEASMHRATKETYALAQREAVRLEGARLMRIQAQQQEITDHVRQDLSERLAAARTRYDALASVDRLRRAPTRTGFDGAATGITLPDLSSTASGTDEAACAAGLSLPERWHATEQALQLDALIDWLSDQLRVRVNDTPAPAAPAAP